MSFSANQKIKKNAWNYLDKKYTDLKIDNFFKNKRDFSKKEELKFNISKINNSCIPTTLSNSSITTNISIVKDKNKEKDKDKYIYRTTKKEKDFPNNSYQYPIKTIIEDSFENAFISKQKIIYKSPQIMNNKIISFQKQKNKLILEFSLFDEKLIFKDINRSYLQDQCSDDGSESSDEKIIESKKLLSLELEDSIKQLSNSLKKNQKENLLSRRMRFKH